MKKDHKTINLSHAKQERFLRAFEKMGQILPACRAAQIHRQTHYDWLKNDPDYGQRFKMSKKIALTELEDEAVERARYGIKRPMLYKGKPVRIQGKILYEHKYSDQLLIRLLEAIDPEKYRSNPKKKPTPQETTDDELMDYAEELLNRHRMRHPGRIEELQEGLQLAQEKRAALAASVAASTQHREPAPASLSRVTDPVVDLVNNPAFAPNRFPGYKTHWNGKEKLVQTPEEMLSLGPGWGLAEEFEPYLNQLTRPLREHDPTKWLPHWLKSKVPLGVRDRIKAKLIEVDQAYWKNPGLDHARESMLEVFRGVGEILFAHELLTEHRLRSDVTELVWESAIAGGWYSRASAAPKRIFPERIGHCYVWREPDWKDLFENEIKLWSARLLVSSVIEVISDSPDWISIRSRCDLETAERITGFFRELATDLAAELRDQASLAFRELLMKAIEGGGRLDPEQKVELHFIRTERSIVYFVRDPGQAASMRKLSHAEISQHDDPIERAILRGQIGTGLGLLAPTKFADELIYSASGTDMMFVKRL